jgi:hypothetical protein
MRLALNPTTGHTTFEVAQPQVLLRSGKVPGKRLQSALQVLQEARSERSVPWSGSRSNGADHGAVPYKEMLPRSSYGADHGATEQS